MRWNIVIPLWYAYTISNATATPEIYTETDFLDDLWEDVLDENGNEFEEDSEDTWNGMAEDAAMEGSLFGWEA